MRNDETFQPLRKRNRRPPRAAAVRFMERNNRIGEARTRAEQAGCKKLTFATKPDAEAHIVKADDNRAGLKRPLHHAYHCPHCSAWHTTSSRHRYRIRPE